MATPRSSAARPDPGAPSGPRAAALAGPSVPDVTLPLRFILTGLLSLLLGVGCLVARPDLLTAYHYHQHIVAVTHLFLLGFILSIVLGATYQLVPVVLETQLHSERLARWHYPIHVISVAGMIWTFWVWDMKDLGHFGSGLALGIGFFVWNIGRTLFRTRRWTVISFGIASSLVWLVAVVAAGLALAAAKSTYELVGRPDIHPLLAVPLAGLKATAEALSHFEPLAVMHAHAHLGVLGVFILLTVAVAYRLVPMFLISDLQNPRRAWASILLLNAGLAAVVVTVLLQSRWKPAAALLTVAGLVLFGLELAAIVRARKRRAIDWGLRGFLSSQVVLGVVAVLGLVLSWPTLVLNDTVGRLENAYGFLAILGVIGFAILGMLYKILPFLVWFAAYAREVGRARTPALHEMYSSRLQATGYGLWLAGLVLTLAGILLASPWVARGGTICLALSLVSFVVNAVLILRHLVRPRLQPWTVPGPASVPTPPASPRTRQPASLPA